MIVTFKRPTTVPGGNYKNPRMEYFRQRLTSNLNRLKSYYRFNDFAVKSDHILVTLINSLLLPPSTDRQRAYDIITNTAYSVGYGLGIGSSQYKAKVQVRNWFYGPNTQEIIYLTPKAPFSFEYPVDWRVTQAVKVITHPKTDLTLRILDGKESTEETGYAVIEIDAGLLHWQYRNFYKEQLLKPAGERLGVNHFVAKFVLPNMLDTHLDVAYFNRLVNYNNGQPVAESLRKAPIALPDTTTYVDEIVAKTIERFSQTPLTVAQILDQIELPLNGTVLQLVTEPNEYVDVQNIKAYRIARAIPYVSLALSLRWQSTNNPDALRPELVRIWKSIHNDRVLNNIRGGDFIKSLFEQQITPYLGV